MKNNITLLLLFLCGITFAQSRKEWRGQVSTDAPALENIIVFNMNTKTGVVTDTDGFFKIQAIEGDTLAFYGLAVKPKKVRLMERDTEAVYVQIKSESFINQLETVEVSKTKMKNPIGDKGSQAIVDQQYFDDNQSSPKNPYTNYDVIPNGVNFVRLYKDIVKLVKKNRAKKTDLMSAVDFSELAVNKFDFGFFTKTLELKDDQIKLFLVFCQNDPKTKTFITQMTKFELMDFMVSKNTEFKRIITSGK